MDCEKRVRFVPNGLSVREAGDGEESRVIEGRAIVFDSETVIYDNGRGYRQCEVIRPSCVTEAFLREQDIKLNLLHSRDASVARNNRGEGTLKLELREDGLWFSAEMPRCDLGDRALELVRNRTYTGCSFEFYPKDYTVTDRSTGDREEYLIEHTAFDRVTALTIAMDPAYDDTSVTARREDWEKLTKNEKRLKQEEDDEREGRHVMDNRDADRERDREIAILETEVR